MKPSVFRCKCFESGCQGADRYANAIPRASACRSSSKLVITVDIQSPCLLIYPINEWNKVADKLLGLSDFQPQERAMKRLMLGYAQECELDANGRVLLTPPLRQYASLEKKTMLVGQLNKFELWMSRSGSSSWPTAWR